MGSNPTLSAEKSFAQAKLFLLPCIQKRLLKEEFYNEELDIMTGWKMKTILFEDTGIMKKKIRILIMLLVLLILLAGTLFLYYHNPKGGLMLACPVRALTGYYCPGCGAGRACYAILHGQWYQAFRYNPLLVIILPWVILYYMICGMQWVIYGEERLSIHIPEKIPLTIFIVLFIYGMVRNIEVYPFMLLAPTAV